MRIVLSFFMIAILNNAFSQEWVNPNHYLAVPPGTIKLWGNDIYFRGMPADSAGNSLFHTSFCRLKENQWDTMGTTMGGVNCFETYLDTLYIGGGVLFIIQNFHLDSHIGCYTLQTIR
ncbi:MAG: hypothetical protein KKA07_05860 [Bacteroidetes bacterium]|nr:hypothetical protein [Bacteroidota bacterium]